MQLNVSFLRTGFGIMEDIGWIHLFKTLCSAGFHSVNQSNNESIDINLFQTTTLLLESCQIKAAVPLTDKGGQWTYFIGLYFLLHHVLTMLLVKDTTICDPQKSAVVQSKENIKKARPEVEAANQESYYFYLLCLCHPFFILLCHLPLAMPGQTQDQEAARVISF